MKVRRRSVAVALGLVALAGPLASHADGQQRVSPAPAPVATDTTIAQATVLGSATPIYVPAEWETPGLTFPLLSEAAVVAVHQDDDSLKFVVGNELGSFRPAPKGGSAFFGQGRPIFGIAAPPILPSRILRPLGTGDAGDRFLGAPPEISDATVIPKIGDTFDDRRHSYAFLGGPPALTDNSPQGSTQFPLPATLAADVNGPDVPDNVPVEPTPSTTTTTTPPFTPGTTPPESTSTTRPPATVPPPGTTIPATTTTTTERTTTTTTSPRTTTTTTPRTTTTSTSTTTSTTSTTSTTTTTTTVPTTTTIPAPPRPSTAFVLGNRHDEADYCLAKDPDGPQDVECDRLFDLTKIRTGQPAEVNVTLWNVGPPDDGSDTDASDLKLFAGAACASGIEGNDRDAGTGDLCDGLKLKVERYATSARTGSPIQCVYGCGATYGGTLKEFATTHHSMSTGIGIGNGFTVNEKAYLVVSVLLPDTGASAGGRGNENKYQGRTATLRLTWRMIS